MQMDRISIKENTSRPLAFVLANGDSSQATKASQSHLQRRIYGDNSATKMTLIAGATGTNTVNIVNKLVTVFAPKSLTN